jgi:hypothetical protein
MSMLVPAGATSWYRLARVKTLGPATFHVRGEVALAWTGTAHDIDVLATTTPTRGGLQVCTVRYTGGVEDTKALWAAFGLVMVSEAPDLAHLYAKVAPPSAGGSGNAGGDMTLSLEVSAMASRTPQGESDAAAPDDDVVRFYAGHPPITATFSAQMTGAQDATLAGTVGATMDMFTSAVTRKIRMGGGNESGADATVDIEGDANVSSLAVGSNISVQGRLRFGLGASGMYAMEKVVDTGPAHLRLTMNEGPGESLQIWGNSCASPAGCGGPGSMQHMFTADGNANHVGDLIIGRKLCLNGTCIDETALKRLLTTPAPAPAPAQPPVIT